MTTATATAFRLTAYYVSDTGFWGVAKVGTPAAVQAHAVVATLADAEAIAAQFPKSHKVRATTLSRPIGGDLRNGTEVVGYVEFGVRLTATRGNERNETGIRRYWAFRKAAGKLGLPVVFERGRDSNAYATEAEFEAAIAG